MKSVFLLLVLAFELNIVHSQESGSYNYNFNNFSVSNAIDCINDRSCPTWYFCDSGRCQCGESHDDVIKCIKDLNTSAVLDGYCVTYDDDTGSTFVGACFYNYVNLEDHSEGDLVYHILPEKPRELINNSVCSWFHRKGLLCGECEEGLSPFVLSYNLSCVECPSGYTNWGKFVLGGFVPLTFFYFFVVIFNINVTSSRLHGVVWFSQALSIPALVRTIFSNSNFSRNHHDMLKAVKVFLPFYSFWNLELFRSVLPDICLNVSTLQALALEYLVALYPLVLILLSYCIIVLHDTKFTPIVIMWKPLHKIFALFRNTWDVRTSVVDSFATIYLLSYVKVLSVSTDLLAPTQVYKLNSNIVMYGLYYSPSVTYFGR